LIASSEFKDELPMTDKKEYASPRYIVRKSKVIRYLQKHGAIDSTSAVSIEELGIRQKDRIISILLEEKTIALVDNLFFIRTDNFKDFIELETKTIFIYAISIYIPVIIFLLLILAWIFTAV
jgi:hypothetical protein